MDVLLLCVKPRRSLANTLGDHIEAIRAGSRHRVSVHQNYQALLGPFGGGISAIPSASFLERYDALVVHYSNYLALPAHFDQASRKRIAAFRGLKAAFIQDEYRTVDATVAALRDMRFDVLFTCVPEQEVEKVYPAAALPLLRKVSTLTGFVPEQLVALSVPAMEARRIDVGYRARVVPFWLGELGAEKWQIAARFSERTRGRGLRSDISFDEKDRLYGPAWVEFLTGCRTVLGVESGASVFDFSGDIQRRVDEYVARNPAASFEEVQAKFLAAHEHRIRLNQISPRAFEAAALRTAMVLYEGEYSGILKPGRHYIELRKDFSNIDHVVAQISDMRLLKDMAACAYEEIALNPAYSHAVFMRQFDEVLDTEARVRIGTRRDGAAEAAHPGTRISLRSRLYLWRGMLIYLMQPAWEAVPEAIRLKLRPLVRRFIR